MTEAAQQLLVQVRQYVVNIFNTKMNPAFVFHNLDHTKDVVKASELLADYYQCREPPTLLRQNTLQLPNQLNRKSQ